MSLKTKVLENGKIILKDTATCPFCKGYPEAVVMPGRLGFCALIECNNPKCEVSPSTHMFEAKGKQGALSKARKAWETRRKK